MNTIVKKLGIAAAAAGALAIGAFAMSAGTSAQADPFVGMDTAEAAALSLAPPYYSLFLYDPCDYASSCPTAVAPKTKHKKH
jgi:hypothetical protein